MITPAPVDNFPVMGCRHLGGGIFHRLREDALPPGGDLGLGKRTAPRLARARVVCVSRAVAIVSGGGLASRVRAWSVREQVKGLISPSAYVIPRARTREGRPPSRRRRLPVILSKKHQKLSSFTFPRTARAAALTGTTDVSSVAWSAHGPSMERARRPFSQ